MIEDSLEHMENSLEGRKIHQMMNNCYALILFYKLCKLEIEMVGRGAVEIERKHWSIQRRLGVGGRKVNPLSPLMLKKNERKNLLMK